MTILLKKYNIIFLITL